MDSADLEETHGPGNGFLKDVFHLIVEHDESVRAAARKSRLDCLHGTLDSEFQFQVPPPNDLRRKISVENTCREYLQPCNANWNHQGFNNELIEPVNEANTVAAK